MEIDEAYRLFGLTEDASEEDIRRAYREASRQSHPDAVDGSDDRQKKVNEAKETLLAYLNIRHAVVPVSPQSLSRYIDHAIARYVGPTSREEADRIQRAAVRPIQHGKWVAWACGAVTGLMALAEKIAPTLFGLDESTSEAFTGALTPVAAMFGVAGLALQLVVSWHKNRTEAAVDRLSDRRTCAEMLAQSLEFRETSTFEEEDLHLSGVRRVFPLAVGPLLACDLRTVLLRKAVEHQLVAVERPGEMTPSYTERYKLTFDPAIFQPPPPEPPPPTRPATGKERLGGIGCAVAVLAGTLGLAAYLHFHVRTRWALLPLIVGVLAFLGGLVLAFAERPIQVSKAAPEEHR